MYVVIEIDRVLYRFKVTLIMGGKVVGVRLMQITCFIELYVYVSKVAALI